MKYRVNKTSKMKNKKDYLTQQLRKYKLKKMNKKIKKTRIRQSKS